VQEKILEEEARFADSQYQSYQGDLDIAPHMFRKYSNPTQMWDWRQRAASLLGNIAGKSLLDLGCGMGEETAYLAKLGANVTAIDISDVGVSITKSRAEKNGLADRVRAIRMGADPTDFPADSFDLVHGLGILHHVGLAAALKEVRRVLKPGGAAVFLEPLGNNPWIERWKYRIQKKLGKKLDLTEVTEHEENLRYADLNRECAQFSSYKLYPFHLTYRIRKLIAPKFLHDRLRAVDHYTLKILPLTRHVAGAVVIHLVK
jgi:SAM-dependent methyltransferase